MQRCVSCNIHERFKYINIYISAEFQKFWNKQFLLQTVFCICIHFEKFSKIFLWDSFTLLKKLSRWRIFSMTVRESFWLISVKISLLYKNFQLSFHIYCGQFQKFNYFDFPYFYPYAQLKICLRLMCHIALFEINVPSYSTHTIGFEIAGPCKNQQSLQSLVHKHNNKSSQ